MTKSLIWASWQENLILQYENNKGPEHQCPLYLLHAIFNFYLVSGAEQAGLSLTWLQNQDRFSHENAQLTPSPAVTTIVVCL